jgi:hypothetical protein
MIKYLNVILFVGMVVMNYLANALPLNNKKTSEISDSFPNLFVPAGVTFAIWGVIYLMLAVYCVVQFTSDNQAIISEFNWLFSLTCIFNALWIVAWHYERLPLSLIITLGLLVSLIYINNIIKPEHLGVIKASFGIYLGWVCIATIANVTALLVYYKWNGWGLSEVAWTNIMIIAGAIIVSFTIYRVNNPFIGLAVIWAFVGIIIKRQSDIKSIVLTAAIAILIVSLITVWGFFRKVPGIA